MTIATVVAKPPKPAPESEDPCSPKEVVVNSVNIAIDDVIAKIKDPNIELFRSSGIESLAVSLKASKPQAVQVVGHGCSGVLSLGYYWSRQYHRADTGCQMVDSNPYSYGTLWDVMPSVRCPVMLIGCFVGTLLPSGMIANGQTLMRDLEQMWGNSVFAAEGYVSPDDFVDGVFAGPLRGSNGEQVFARDVLQSLPRGTMEALRLKAAAAAAGSPFVSENRDEIIFLGLRGVPLLGPRYRTIRAEFPREYARALSMRGYRRVPYRPLLAMPEVEVTVAVASSGQVCFANLLCNGTLLEVWADGAPTLYAATADAAKLTSTIYANIRRVALGGVFVAL